MHHAFRLVTMHDGPPTSDLCLKVRLRNLISRHIVTAAVRHRSVVALSIPRRRDAIKMNVQRLNQHCRGLVLRCQAVWMGRHIMLPISHAFTLPLASHNGAAAVVVSHATLFSVLGHMPSDKCSLPGVTVIFL